MAQSRQLDLWETARLASLVHLAAFDATIVSVRAQYKYDLWSPADAIRLADTDNNRATTAEPGWAPMPTRSQPDRPQYADMMATGYSAVTTVVALFFGTDEVPTVFTNRTIPGFQRSFSRLTDIRREYSRRISGEEQLPL